MSMEHIRSKYRIPVKRGMKVRHKYRPGDYEFYDVTGVHRGFVCCVTADGGRCKFHPLDIEYFTGGTDELSREGWMMGVRVAAKYDPQYYQELKDRDDFFYPFE